jgi:hypothetical protein
MGRRGHRERINKRMDRSKRQFQSLADGGRDEVVRDEDGQLLGNERLGVFLGHVDAFAGGMFNRELLRARRERSQKLAVKLIC